MRINSVNATYSNNYQNPSHRKNETNFRGFLYEGAEECLDYFANASILGYEKGKYNQATKKILNEYSPLAHFHRTGQGICIDDKIKKNPKSCYGFKYLTSYYSLDDIINKREEIELNLINAINQKCDCYNASKDKAWDKISIISSMKRSLEAAQEFFNSNPQFSTDKIQTQLTKTLKNCEDIISKLKA